MTIRKKALFLFILLLSLGIFFAKADTDQAVIPGIDMFVSAWSTDGAQADIQYSDGFFQVYVETFDHGYKRNEWIYLCTYDADQQALIASNTGNKNIYIYDFDTDCESKSTVYQNGSAVFSLDPEGYLVWLDENEDAGKDFLFARMGNYSGIWQCDNISINLYTTGNAYRCIVSKYDGSSIVAKWTYSCEYDAASGNVISDNRNNKEILIGCDEEGEIYDTVYEDGAAVFSINSDGYLLWNDLKENAGSGLLFSKNCLE